MSVDVTDQELLSLAIARSGLSLHAFARDVLVRDPRSVQRWLDPGSGQSLPRAVRKKCAEILNAPPPE